MPAVKSGREHEKNKWIFGYKIVIKFAAEDLISAALKDIRSHTSPASTVVAQGQSKWKIPGKFFKGNYLKPEEKWNLLEPRERHNESIKVAHPTFFTTHVRHSKYVAKVFQAFTAFQNFIKTTFPHSFQQATQLNDSTVRRNQH